MSFHVDRFLTQFPSIWKDIQEVLSEDHFVPVLVGGVVRDYLLYQVMGKDWDIEITHPTVTFNKDQWKQFGRRLSHLGRVNYLAYDVIRLEAQGHQFEFSPPRKETFSAHWENEGHKNFSAEFDMKLPFTEAVKRRDFTLNAMGVKVLSHNKAEFLDPLEGIRHLREKVLHPCGPDFKKDPVRFLRAIRFALRFELEFSPELFREMEIMPVGTISASYLWSEMNKSGHPIRFYEDLLKWKERKTELKLPLGAELLPKIDELKRVLIDPLQHESWIMALELVGLSGETWGQFFQLGPELPKRLSRWAQTTKFFKGISPEAFHGEFEAFKDQENFLKLFDWYFSTKQICQKNPDLPILKMIEEYVPEWIHLYQFEPLKDVKHIDPPYRAKYQVWNLCQRL